MDQQQSFSMSSASLRLSAELVPWDTAAFNVPVAQISAIELPGTDGASQAWGTFMAWLDARGVNFVSCRLGHSALAESMFLEQHGFRFVEMVLHPYVMLEGYEAIQDLPLKVEHAVADDLPLLRRIAEVAFSHERYHMDPRIDKRLADLRYGRWVEQTLHHPLQRLFKLSEGGETVALFITEDRLTEDRRTEIYWHLTAIAPCHQGRGYGRRAWLTMLSRHQAQGAVKVSTTIAARNCSVLNLYSQLRFRFAEPEMSFHWVR